MEQYRLKTVEGSYDIEVIDSNIATVSKTNGKCYLTLSQVPSSIQWLAKKQGFKWHLLPAKKLNKILGLKT